MRVEHRTVGEFQENSYLVIDDASGRAVLVDPGGAPEVLIDLVRDSGATLDAIWITHAHVDHIGGIAGVRRAWPVPVFMHPADQILIDQSELAARVYDVEFEKPDNPDAALGEGQRVSVGGLRFDVMHCPGHAPGHVIFVGNGIVLGGDMLFAGSIGRTDLPYCDAAAMQHSLARMAALDPDLFVYPGHGEPTTIGRELATNPFLDGIVLPVKT